MKLLILLTILPLQFALAAGPRTGKEEAVQISVGGGHSCARFKSGRAMCWGNNRSGQLGWAEKSENDRFKYVAIDEEIMEIVAGGGHTCALLKGGRAKCWGDNQSGKANFKDSSEEISYAKMRNLPDLDLGEKIKSISADYYRTCAVLESGKAKCWGKKLEDQSQPKNGFFSFFDNMWRSIDPLTEIKFNEKIKSISLNGFYICALLESGKVRCWGENEGGRLGVGRKEAFIGKNAWEMEHLTTVLIDEKVVQLDGGCGLLESGRAKCWGINRLGQLGIGSSVDTVGSTPEEMQNLPYVLIPEKIKAIQQGCALLENGEVRCWGYNAYGQVGVGIEKYFTGKLPEEMEYKVIPTEGEDVVQIATGGNHTCALFRSGGVKCWGQNGYGQLGIDDFLNRGVIDYGDNSFPWVKLP